MNLPPKKYFGSIRYARSMKNYHISVSRHLPGEQIPNHYHQNPYLSLNLGSAYLENNLVTDEIIAPGMIVFRPANYEHQNSFRDDTGLCFNIELIADENVEVRQLLNKKVPEIGYTNTLKILTKSLARYADDELDCLITETLMEGNESGYSGKIPVWYQKVIEKIREEYDQTLTLNVLGNSVNLHPNYLARKFKSISGVSLGDYIRKLRLEKASLKIASEKRLTDIALESGFYDQPHFSNLFYSVFDITPRDLRNSFLG